MDYNLDFNFQINETLPYRPDACEEIEWSTAAGSLKFIYIALLIITVLGLVGNALIIVVFSSREMRTVSANIYLLALAISHSLCLLATFFNVELHVLHCWFSPSTATPPLAHSNLFICASLHSIISVTAHFSTWLLLAFAADRSMAMFTPTFYKNRCTVAVACCITVVIFVVTSAVTVPIQARSFRITEHGMCMIAYDSFLMFTILPFSEFVQMYFFPTIVIVMLDQLVIIHTCLVRRTKRRRRLQLSPQNDVMSGVESGDIPIIPIENKGTETEQRADVNRKHKYPPSDDERNRQLTTILILISVTHIVLRTPEFFVWLWWRFILVDEGVTQIVDRCCYLLQVSFFATTFVLYTLSGSIFREHLTATCRCGRERRTEVVSTVQSQPTAPSEVM